MAINPCCTAAPAPSRMAQEPLSRVVRLLTKGNSSIVKTSREILLENLVGCYKHRGQ